MRKLAQVTGMWWRKSAKGQDFQVGRVKKETLIEELNKINGDEVNLMLFRNNMKNTDRHPDWILTAGEVQRRNQQNTQQNQPAQQSQPQQASAQVTNDNPPPF